MRRYAEVAPIGLWLASIGLALVFYPRLPVRLVTHFGPTGQPDGWTDKLLGLSIIPVAGLLLYLLLSFIPRLATRQDRGNVAELSSLLFWLKTVLLVFFLSIQWIQISVSLGLRKTLDFALFAPLLSAVLFVAGYSMYKAKRNYFVGFRLPWTLADDEVWLRTNRPAGLAFMGTSILILPLFLLSPAWAFGVMICALLLQVLVFSVYAYILYRRKFSAP